MLARTSAPLLALALVAGGCVAKNTVSVEPYSICFMPDDCKFSATCGAQYIGSATLDVTGGNEMWLAVEVHNQENNNADTGIGRGNTHDAHFESYSVEYSGAPGLTPPNTGDLPASGQRTQQVIPASGTAVIGVTVILQDVADSLATSTAVPTGPDYVQVHARVKLKGRTDDGTKWEAPFDVPIRICRDCIGVSCDFGQLSQGACPSASQLPKGKDSCVDVPTCLSAGSSLCGTNVLHGDAKTRYGCSEFGALAAPAEVCSYKCLAAANGTDFCQPPPACDAAGDRCGERLANGVAGTLYTCAAAGAVPSSEKVCAGGCVQGNPDACP